ncbi:MAG TPA: hypothetical protein VIW03_09815, partial [Anaeromyxobacter sp.]
AVTPADRRAGDAIATSAGELARLWRTTRAQARPDVWPGLMDGLVDELFARTGEALAAGRDPALLWPALVGVVRVDPRDAERSRAELDEEWDLAEGVLTAACDALGSGEAVREWIARAIVLARAGARTLDAGGGPRGIVVVRWLSGLASARRRERDAGRR